MSDPGMQKRQKQQQDDDDSGGGVVIIAKHTGTGRYTTLSQDHLSADHPEVQQKLSYLNGDSD